MDVDASMVEATVAQPESRKDKDELVGIQLGGAQARLSLPSFASGKLSVPA